MTGINYIDRVLCHTKGGIISRCYSIPKEALAKDVPRPEPYDGYDVLRHPDTLITIYFSDETTSVLRDDEFVTETATGSLDVFTQSNYWLYVAGLSEVRLPDGGYHRWTSSWNKQYSYTRSTTPKYTYAKEVWTVVTREPIEEAPKGGR